VRVFLKLGLDSQLPLNNYNREKMKVKNLFILVLVLVLQSCTNPTLDREAELKIIAQTIDSCIGWAKEKDLNLLFTIIANDPDYLSVHPSARVVRGFEEFKSNSSFWMNPDFQYVRHEIRDLKINLSKSGDVAWFYCVLDDLNEWKGQPANWENTRWTGVLEKEKSAG